MSWWEQPYPGGPMVGPASGFDDTYGNGFSHGKGGNVVDSGVAGFQRQMNLDDTGWIGEKTFNALRSARIPTGLPNAGQPLLDQIAIDLINDYNPPPSQTPIEKVRAAITSFCQQGLAEPDWYYTQARAIDITVNPNGPANSDCSGSAMQMFKWAAQQTGIAVPDPSKQGWSGYGNTNYYQDDWPTVTSGSYLVGDLAHYDGHVCVCMKAGNKDTADWWSFGSEPPSKRKLNYRSDFRKVVRPKLVP
jgi:hypothetical protein